MKVKTVIYQRVKNLGNYESERLEMFAEVEEGEDSQDVASTLIQQVNDILFPPEIQIDTSTDLEDLDFPGGEDF